ncbi:Rossmann-like and DUF2520 domain-containing protein [Halioxenophilus sp. WMMB6]|uniref:Rossmann-like and DUF2520 domain-containing protein n=1 Tax=Halioxenophilus sp. WMMB6 TaxID=3073815 RepID=UPI00295ED726|nr:Rossmann-like and DUF2520 domain-containing protein [Halioxenophilus sp. WMMB6]
MKPRINIIGSGRVGRTLARRWQDSALAEIGQIVNRSPEQSQAALAFIGAGSLCQRLQDLQPADIWLVTAPDGAIASLAEQLAALPLAWSGSVVCHCSGAHGSQLLAALAERGAAIASVHPIHSFANPEASLASLAGCYAGAEGEPQALAQLQPLFTGIGLHWLTLNGEHKKLYHAAAVFACNYFVTLLHSAEQCLQAAGSDNNLNLAILRPLIEQTLSNTLSLGPTAALTGPVQRAEVSLLQQQWQAITQLDPKLAELYRALAQATMAMASPQQQASQAWQQMQALFQQPLASLTEMSDQ